MYTKNILFLNLNNSNFKLKCQKNETIQLDLYHFFYKRLRIPSKLCELQIRTCPPQIKKTVSNQIFLCPFHR